MLHRYRLFITKEPQIILRWLTRPLYTILIMIYHVLYFKKYFLKFSHTLKGLNGVVSCITINDRLCFPRTIPLSKPKTWFNNVFPIYIIREIKDFPFCSLIKNIYLKKYFSNILSVIKDIPGWQLKNIKTYCLLFQLREKNIL